MDRRSDRELAVIIAAAVSIPALVTAVALIVLGNLFISAHHDNDTPNNVVARRWPATSAKD